MILPCTGGCEYFRDRASERSCVLTSSASRNGATAILSVCVRVTVCVCVCGIFSRVYTQKTNKKQSKKRLSFNRAKSKKNKPAHKTRVCSKRCKGERSVFCFCLYLSPLSPSHVHHTLGSACCGPPGFMCVASGVKGVCVDRVVVVRYVAE